MSLSDQSCACETDPSQWVCQVLFFLCVWGGGGGLQHIETRVQNFVQEGTTSHSKLRGEDVVGKLQNSIVFFTTP